jgi:hypothetical protein
LGFEGDGMRSFMDVKKVSDAMASAVLVIKSALVGKKMNDNLTFHSHLLATTSSYPPTFWSLGN